MSHSLRTAAGKPCPLGATVYPAGVNFAIFSRNATAVELLLFDHYEDSEPRHVLSLDPGANHTFYYWHIFVFGLKPGQIYAYRVDGPYKPEEGHRFDPSKVLIDPYAREVIYGANWSRQRAKETGDNCAQAIKCVIVTDGDYDWENDAPLGRRFEGTVIYEMHVGGFTKHASSGVDHPGTYHGVIEKIPYLQSLGITAVELLPVQQFDEQDVNHLNAADTDNHVTCNKNYWGYNPVSFFSPHRAYCTSLENGRPVQEFRDLVKALHRAGIEVIIDVVFNHTAEGDDTGPTLCYRGLENRAYYLLDPTDLSQYSDYTGTGNTVNGNHSVVRRLILNALRYWVQEMHVDGFRFDLASVLSRDEEGQPMDSPPVLWDIESDPCLAGTKIIAEAWDAAGLYQVGTFIGHRWAEWNGHYRDDVRRFWRGDNGTVVDFAARIIGSPDIYTAPDHALHRSINFVTAHDGFTLNDLVSYNKKHNFPNGEDNQDGADENFSCNYGYEGPTTDPEIEQLRLRQIKNALTTLLVSQGTPMLLFGDEVRRTQQGNNNAYCQDNEISWLNWEGIEGHQGLLRFFRHLVQLNREHPILNLEMYTLAPEAKGGLSTVDSLFQGRAEEHMTWHGVQVNEPDWGYYSHSIALTLHGREDDDNFHMVFNAYKEQLEFELPPCPNGGKWLRLVDTNRPSPDDFREPGEENPVEGDSYLVAARSVVILIAHRPDA
jgi:isoamylase